MNPGNGPAPNAEGEWECMECGHVAEGAQARRPTQCPDCGAPGQALEFFSYGEDQDDAWESESAESLYDEEEDELVNDDDDERPETRFFR